MKYSNNEILLMAVGDIYINREDPNTTFRDILPLLNNKDILLGNLETTLFDDMLPIAPGRTTALKASQRMVEGIVNANFDIMCISNTHTTDYGPTGLLKTIEVLDRNKILHTGAGKNLDEALKPVIIEKNNLKIGFLSYEATVWSFFAGAEKGKPGAAKIIVNPLLPSPHVAKEDIVKMAENIRKVKSTIDVLVVSLHCGAELTTTLTPHQKSIAHSAVDAGADIIIGHHPHVIQGIELYKGKVICYSLGNFVFDNEIFKNPEDATIIFKANITPTKINVSLIPVLNDKGNLKLLERTESKYKEILRKITELSQELGTKIDQTKGELNI
ncbi:MAG: CapA family protein [Atribacterota bacterium]|nr:CapA family protein [Atribacterota bacterium]